MNTIASAFHPSSMLAAVAHFLQDIHRPRGESVNDANEPSLMDLYRLTRGRETIAPAVGAVLANRFKA